MARSTSDERRDLRLEAKQALLDRVFPRGGRELKRFGRTLELSQRGTTSGVEYKIELYRFAQWDFTLTIWRAG